MSAPDDTRQKQGKAPPFQRGRSGNPAGRPRGARSKLSEDFLAAIYADFAEHGAAVIATVRQERPDVYLKVIASLLPRELRIEGADLADLSDEDLTARIRHLAAACGLDIVEADAEPAVPVPITRRDH